MELNQTSTTKCGHRLVSIVQLSVLVIWRTKFTTWCSRYCDKCIRECLVSSDKCPLCNQTISADQLIRDLQFDNLRGTRTTNPRVDFSCHIAYWSIDITWADDLKVLKEKQMHALISKLVSPNNNNDGESIELTPLENVMRSETSGPIRINLKGHSIDHVAVFHLPEHFIKSLQIHQNYVQSLKKSCILEMESIDEKTRIQIEMLSKTNPFGKLRFRVEASCPGRWRGLGFRICGQSQRAGRAWSIWKEKSREQSTSTSRAHRRLLRQVGPSQNRAPSRA